MKLIIIIVYILLPAGNFEFNIWSSEAECHKIGNMIKNDLIASPLISSAEYYCVGNDD